MQKYNSNNMFKVSWLKHRVLKRVYFIANYVMG
jgi:hypothetical protein